jgi:signal transduction histidine kinase
VKRCGPLRARSRAPARRESNLSPAAVSTLSALLGLASEPRLDARMLARLAAQLARALAVPALSVRLLDHSGRWLDLKASFGFTMRMRKTLRRLPIASPVGREVVQRGRRLVRAGDFSQARPPAWSRLVAERFGAVAFVPIRSGTRVLGTLGVGYHESTQPPSSHVRFLEALGGQLGAALQVVRARQARRKARSESRFLRKITAALSANLDLRAVLDMVTFAAARLTHASGAIVLLQSRDGREFEVASSSPYDPPPVLLGSRFPVTGSLSGQVVRNGRSIRSRDLSVDRRPMIRELQRMANVRGLLIVPLRGAEGVIGTLAVSSERPRLFSDHDRHILTQLGQQASIAIQNARLFDAVRNHRQLLRQLYSQQFAILEGERKRIAHELHDEMGPTLSAILINLQLFKEHPGGDGALAGRVAETERLLTAIIEKIRELSYGLRPPMLEHLGLAESLKWMIDTYFSAGRLAVDYRHSGARTRLDPELALAVYRIAQEALTNVVKHAAARTVTVRLSISASAVQLRVRDDGCGFDSAKRPNGRREGLGLASMRERMDHLNGRMDIRSMPGKGTQLTVECPVGVRDASPPG